MTRPRLVAHAYRSGRQRVMVRVADERRLLAHANVIPTYLDRAAEGN
jgi:hypothetical protein